VPESESPGYLRHPSIAGDQVVFVAEDDLWTVPAGGGIARRLTTALSDVTLPCLRPDGRLIAFVAREDGPSEVYVVGAEGGTPRQLTHLGAGIATSGWSPDGRVAFVSDARAPFPGGREPFLVAAEGGEPERLPWGPANRVALSPDGGVVIGRNVGDPARWKRYRGGTAGEFWIDAAGSGTFVRWAGPPGNLASPMWIGGRVYFLSDHEGTGNLYSARPDGGDLRRHTDHAEYYARNAQTDGRRIIYHAGGQLHLFDPASGTGAPVPVELRSQRTQRSRRFVDAGRYLDGVDPHPRGHSLLVTTRGHAFAFGHWEGPVLPAGEAHGVRYRLARWLPDGERMVAVADAGGEEALEIHRLPVPSGGGDPDVALAGPPVRRLEALDVGRATDLTVSPLGERLALANHRNELMVVDLATGTAALVERNAFGPPRGAAWSPDGRWLCYAAPLSRKTTALRLLQLRADGGIEEPVTITDPVLRDVSPAFDPEGRYLYFLSYRTFNPVYDQLQFDLGFPRGVRPYLICLRADTPSPFQPRPRPLVDDGRDRDGGPSGGDTGDDPSTGGGGADEGARGAEPAAGDRAERRARGERAPAPVRIDLEGIAERVCAFPVPEGRYRRIAGIRGRAVFSSSPVKGSLGEPDRRGRPRDQGVVESYDLRELRLETLAHGVRDFWLTPDARTLVYRSTDRLRVVAAGKKPEDRGGEETGRRSGWVDLGRVRVAVDPGREWAQMLREAWRLQRDNFWTPDMSGVDWDLVWERYSRLLPRIATRGELSDLMWEMQGELGTSHAYEMGGDYRHGPGYGQGFLGADLVWDAGAGGYRIEALVRGDPWAEGQGSPLRAPGVRVRPGDVILAVDGRAVSAGEPVGALLVGKGGAEVALTLAAAVGSGYGTARGGDRGEAAPEGGTAGGGAPGPLPANAGTSPPDAGGTAPGDPLDGAAEAPPAKGEATAPAASAQAGGPPVRTVVVRTVSSERAARYRDWVLGNRAFVHAGSGGRIGYIHIPDMGPRGYAEFHRAWLTEAERDGLVVDVRHNGGGHVSQLILEKLARRPVGYDVPRWGQPDPYPADAVPGPVVALCDEHAGSDGDIFSHCFKLMGIGPLVGRRTWGGVIGISVRHPLVDGTSTSQPEFSYWFRDVGWGVENYGTDPDIPVEYRPEDHRDGRDPQLRRALDEALAWLAERPVRRPAFDGRPSRALPTLPPR